MTEIDYAHLRRLCGWDMTTRRPGGTRRIVHAGLTWPGLVMALLDENDRLRRDAALGAKVREGVMTATESFPLGMLIETCEDQAEILRRRRYGLASGAMDAIAAALREEADHA